MTVGPDHFRARILVTCPALEISAMCIDEDRPVDYLSIVHEDKTYCSGGTGLDAPTIGTAQQLWAGDEPFWFAAHQGGARGAGG